MQVAKSQADSTLHLPDDGAYIIRYDDTDRPDELFARAGARDAALKRFDQISTQWNAHLFVKIASNSTDEPCPNAFPIGLPSTSTEKTATQEELAEYERLVAWRARWSALASKREPGRLQSRQERIERRALVCNLNIAKLMRAFDVRINNTVNPIGQKAVNNAAMALLLASH